MGEYAPQIGDALHALLEAHSLHAYLPGPELEAYRQKRQRALEERHRRQMAITQIQEMSGSTSGQQTMSANLVEALREFDRQTEQLVIEAWLECLLRLSAGRRLVFLLDNYDVFQETASLESVKSFWGAVERAHQHLPGVRVVLASREKVRHRDSLRALQAGLAEEPEELEPLRPEDSDVLLRALKVEDAAFRQAVYSRLAGGHPLLTRMAAEAWLETPGGISANTIPELANREQAVEWVQGRILDRLSGPLKQAVRWAALLRRFHADSLNAILETSLSEDDFRALTRYAFIVHPRLAPDYWACHDLVRRVQMAYLRRARPDEFKSFHQRSEVYFQEHGHPLEALYHHFFQNLEEAFAVWAELESRAAFAFDHPAWAALIEMGLAPEISLPPNRQAETNFRAGRRHYYRAEWDLADSHLHEALRLFRDIGAKLGEANVRKAIGDVQQFRKQSDAALKSYEQALALFRDIGDRLGEANVLYSQGRLFVLSGKGQEGFKLLQEALDIYTSIGSVTSQSNVYFFVGQVAAERGKPGEAVPLLEKAVELGASVAPDHPVTEYMRSVLEAVRAQVK